MIAKLIKYIIERNAITPSIESLLIKKPITTVEKLPMNFPIFMIKLLAVATMYWVKIVNNCPITAIHSISKESNDCSENQ